MNATIATLTRWRRSLERMVRRICCRHEWTLRSRDQYNVMRSDGSKEGEVTITLIECRKCGLDKLLATDRTHAPNEKLCNSPGSGASPKPETL